MYTNGNIGLTWVSLPNLLRGQPERGEKFHQYLDKEFSHSDCGSDHRVDIEAIQQMFDGLEQLDKGIITVLDALDRLK